MRCEHDDDDWATFVAGNGDLYHACRKNDAGFVLSPGAPGPGYGPDFSPSKEGPDAMTVVPSEWRKLGW